MPSPLLADSPTTFQHNSMKQTFLPVVSALAVLLVSCDQQDTNGTTGDGQPAPEPTPSTSAPPAPSAEVVAALEAQPLGKKLLGHTLVLSGKKLVKQDLQVAPEFYFVYYSASW